MTVTEALVTLALVGTLGALTTPAAFELADMAHQVVTDRNEKQDVEVRQLKQICGDDLQNACSVEYGGTDGLPGQLEEVK